MSSTIIKVAISPEQRIRALLRNTDPKIRRAFLNAVRNVKSSINISTLANLLEQGLLDEALQLINSIPISVSTAISFGFVASGTDTAILLTDVLNQTVQFDQFTQRATNLMQNTRLRLVQEFNAEQRRATIEALTQGIQRGANPREQARIFRDSIGLTNYQNQVVDNYRRSLENGSRDALNRQLRDRRFDRTVLRSVNGDEPLTATQINRMVDRYRERYLSYRSEVIARTESLRVVHQGVDEMYQQAFEQNILNPDDLVREWITSQRSNVRDSHNGMHGQKRPVNEPFISDHGAILRYPGDELAPAAETVQCVCVLTTRFK